MYEKGLKQRRNAETSLNLTSSRSHAILTLYVVRLPIDTVTEIKASYKLVEKYLDIKYRVIMDSHEVK